MTEAERIKKRLRECKRRAEVNAVADDERKVVMAMLETDKVMAIQISNLKHYMLKMLTE